MTWSWKSVLNFLYHWLWVLLFYIYLAGNLFFLLAIESTFNGGFDFSVRVLWLPLAIVVFCFTWFNRQALYAQVGSRWKTWAGATNGLAPLGAKENSPAF
jgi:hypothetical protein